MATDGEPRWLRRGTEGQHKAWETIARIEAETEGWQEVSPRLKCCRRHGTYQPGNPGIPGGRCPECVREHNSLPTWRRKRGIRSGWE
jgi:hypothetical protein